MKVLLIKYQAVGVAAQVAREWPRRDGWHEELHDCLLRVFNQALILDREIEHFHISPDTSHASRAEDTKVFGQEDRSSAPEKSFFTYRFCHMTLKPRNSSMRRGILTAIIGDYCIFVKHQLDLPTMWLTFNDSRIYCHMPRE
jgi:hypothetical protein